jgi:hypothetical protein
MKKEENQDRKTGSKSGEVSVHCNAETVLVFLSL